MRGIQSTQVPHAVFGERVDYRGFAEGEPIRGERTICEAEAEIIRRVFREFASGVSPRTIARRLNDKGVPGPDGALWTDSTLRGHAARGTGFLNNELYIGKLVWNRLRYIKDPATGKRVSRINPHEKWIRTEVPELRIIDDALWQAVKERQGELATRYANVTTAIRAAHARLNGTHPPIPPFRSARLRMLRWPLCLARAGPLRLFQSRNERELSQQPQHQAGRTGLSLGNDFRMAAQGTPERAPITP